MTINLQDLGRWAGKLVQFDASSVERKAAMAGLNKIREFESYDDILKSVPQDQVVIFRDADDGLLNVMLGDSTGQHNTFLAENNTKKETIFDVLERLVETIKAFSNKSAA